MEDAATVIIIVLSLFGVFIIWILLLGVTLYAINRLYTMAGVILNPPKSDTPQVVMMSPSGPEESNGGGLKKDDIIGFKK